MSRRSRRESGKKDNGQDACDDGHIAFIRWLRVYCDIHFVASYMCDVAGSCNQMAQASPP